AMLAALRGPLDLPASRLPFSDATRIRPPGHRRSFYRRVDGGVVALKGSEPTCEDFPSWVAEMAANPVHVELTYGQPHADMLLARAEMRATEKWALIEGKVPGGYTVREGLDEARAALDFQRAHVARYGAPARAPLPLAVLRWPEEV